MEKRWKRARTTGALFSETLEDRYLLSGGLVGGANLLRELGSVTPAAAIRGVEATATIAAGESVTFRFELQATADYTLLVRHTGDGITLVAKTPDGSASIPVGPVGPFQVVPLHLPAGTYEVTAAARGGQPVFVDWDLLLSSGVGHAAATGLATVLPPVYLQSSGSAAPASLAYSSGAGTSMAPEGTPTSSSQAQGFAQSSFGAIVSGPVGRPMTRDSTLPLPLATIAATTGSHPARALTEHDMAQTGDLQAAAKGRSSAPTESDATVATDALIETAIRELTAAASDGTPVAAADFTQLADERADSAGKERISLMMLSPGLVLGGVGVVIAKQGRRKSKAPTLARSANSKRSATAAANADDTVEFIPGAPRPDLTRSWSGRVKVALQGKRAGRVIQH